MYKSVEEHLIEVANRVTRLIKSMNSASDHDFIDLALHAYFIKKDIVLSKQFCYILAERMRWDCNRAKQIPDYRHSLLGIDNMYSVSMALLSDCLPLLKQFQDLRYNGREYLHQRGGMIIYALECILNDDWEEVKKIENIAKELMKKNPKKFNYVPYLTAWRGYQEGRTDLVFEAVNEMISQHDRTNDFPLLNDLISCPALGYAKLAWLQGMEIDFNHPLIPQAMLPYQPLEVYDDKHEYLKCS